MTLQVNLSRLAALGFGPVHEQVYLYLVHSGENRTAREVAEALQLSPRVARNLLQDLDRAALIITTLTRPPGYMAGPPEIALESLINRRTAELDQVRLLAKELQGEYREAAESGSAAELVEVIIGREKVVRCLTQLTENAKHTFDSFTKPPYVAVVDTDALMLAQEMSIRRGLRARSVYEGGGLNEERTLAVAEQSSRMGEQVRITPQLPMKLALFDGHTGLVPLKVDEPGVGVLLVHASPLLDALIALFDSVWARSVPLPSADRPGNPPDGLDQRSRQVLLLMSSGLKDESIGRVLGMSRRTVQKHVSEVMTLLGARSRFQAALLAQERGWVAGER